MKTLVVERDGRITVHEVNKPRYNEYQALVKTIACGMCGTDIKLIHRTFKASPNRSTPLCWAMRAWAKSWRWAPRSKALKWATRCCCPLWILTRKTCLGWAPAGAR